MKKDRRRPGAGASAGAGGKPGRKRFGGAEREARGAASAGAERVAGRETRGASAGAMRGAERGVSGPNGAGGRGAGEGMSPSGAPRTGARGARAAQADSTRLASLPVQIGQEVSIDIVGISHEGEGVGRVEGYTLFVSGDVLPGEKAIVRVEKLKSSFGHARLVQRLEDSADRVVAPCAVYEACGGCQLQTMSYEAQLRWKRQSVADALKRIGKFEVALADECSEEQRAGGAEIAESAAIAATDSTAHSNNSSARIRHSGDSDGSDGSEGAANRIGDHSDIVDSVNPMLPTDSNKTEAILVRPTLGMSDPWRYRNKVHVPTGVDREGGLIAGFYEPGSHRIVDMDTCWISGSEGDQAVALVKEIAIRLGIKPYLEATHTGLLRHVVVRFGAASGEVMVVLVTNGPEIPRVDEWVESIRAEVPGIASIIHNINTDRTNLIFGDETSVLWGRDVIYDSIGDVRFAISARSFYQVNPVQTEVLYRTAVDYAGLTGSETVVDAYCGIGTISLFLARKAGRVYGVEIVGEAVADAERNAELNGITNAEFALGRAEDVLPAWRREGIVPDVIVVDPPRKGCDRTLLDTILAMRPERVVYVSCSPSTLARDLRILADGGYRVVEAQPVDMFPHTGHIETVALLVRSGTEG
ncbi:23S rRNA (uracil(1939)-C(5))-methyltransferase RlmD [Paenibacillus turpanensis]|uniref:23S rRNA (uracil(1939)-C(5))-methyltransferase RlmD n=1 Tax=Paenibacillus turpanensis TaxID=2689078 RepID=UPI001FB7FBA5|nr:23S rRNA (uracil(1939)-C(5))-methyltransferase RlmD [Paenibacillus turpanensis]